MKLIKGQVLEEVITSAQHTNFNSDFNGVRDGIKKNLKYKSCGKLILFPTIFRSIQLKIWIEHYGQSTKAVYK